MVDIETFRKLALSFQGTEENPHFNRAAFKVIGKRIFATLHEESQTANIILSKTDQQAFCSFDGNAVYPVPNKFGLHGWTTFELEKVPPELISEALFTAYNEVSKPKSKKNYNKKISIKK
jgi:hypothetical protein